MLDNDLIRIFLPIISEGLAQDGFLNVQVIQSNQPTMQGVNLSPTVYFYKLANKRYGFLRRYDEWDQDLEEMIHKESQVFETTFTVQALVRQNPKVTNKYTASDLVNEVASILQSDAARKTLIESDVGILRIQPVTNPYFTDDRDQYEASPSFDFTLTYTDTRVTITPVIESFEYDIYRV